MHINSNWLKEFDAAHGHDFVSVGENGHWFLYADGAMRENSPYGAAIQPPKNRFERAKLILQHREVWLARAVKALNDYQEKLLADDFAYTGQKYHLRELERLMAIVDERKKAVLIARRNKKRADPNYVPRAERIRIENERSHNAAHREAFREKVKRTQV